MQGVHSDSSNSLNLTNQPHELAFQESLPLTRPSATTCFGLVSRSLSVRISVIPRAILGGQRNLRIARLIALSMTTVRSRMQIPVPTIMMMCCACMCCFLGNEPVAGSVVRGRRRTYEAGYARVKLPMVRSVASPTSFATTCLNSCARFSRSCASPIQRSRSTGWSPPVRTATRN